MRNTRYSTLTNHTTPDTSVVDTSAQSDAHKGDMSMSDTIVVDAKFIKRIQALLIINGVHHAVKEKGLWPIPLIGDGEWGQHSRAALQRYQEMVGLEVAGELNPETLEYFEGNFFELDIPEKPTMQQIKAIAFLNCTLTDAEKESIILDGEGNNEALRLVANAYITLLQEIGGADITHL
ncbi:MAG: peptidoglycan-binding protein [Patescibacteria group bacterium]